jgi:redox-sensitive bicupin YhaK (pirin superfamily)
MNTVPVGFRQADRGAGCLVWPDCDEHRRDRGRDTREAALLVFHPGGHIAVRATRPARLMFLGGAALEGPRYIWWNFVSSRRE